MHCLSVAQTKKIPSDQLCVYVYVMHVCDAHGLVRVFVCVLASSRGVRINQLTRVHTRLSLG